MGQQTCQTCRWWIRQRGGNRDWYLGELEVRDDAGDAVEPQPFEIRYCTSPLLRTYERPAQDGAATIDGSQYFSALVTGPDFGCIHHTPEL